MQDVQLEDGTWVTTPMWAGVGLKDGCLEEKHHWESQGPRRQPEKPGEVPIQMERCSRCSWLRVRYLEDPHPEVQV